MELRPGLYPGLKIDTSLTRYEIQQIEKYEAEEINEFEQYVKIIQFAKAVRFGTHPRVRIFLPLHASRVCPLSPEASEAPKAVKAPKTPQTIKDSNVEPVAIKTEEVDATKILNTIQNQSKKSKKKKLENQSQVIKTPEVLARPEFLKEDQPGPVFLNDVGMDYYKLLGLDSIASIDDIQKAYDKLKQTHDPQSDEGKSKWQGKHPAILRDFKQIWNNIQCAFMVLSHEKKKRLYDSCREKYLTALKCRHENKLDEAARESMLRFAALREDVVRSVGAPHPDDPPEPYNEDFFKRATAGITVEEKDINFAINCYGILTYAFKKNVWDGVIRKDTFGKLLRDISYLYIGKLREAKNEKILNKTCSEWKKKLTAIIILRNEKLRSKYQEQNRSYTAYEKLQKEHDAEEPKIEHKSEYIVPEQKAISSRSKASVPKGNPFRKLSTAREDTSIDEAPPTDPLVPLRETPRMPFASSPSPVVQLNLRRQPGLKMGSAPVFRPSELSNLAGSALHLLESGEQSPAKKKQRIENKELGGKREVRGNGGESGDLEEEGGEVELGVENVERKRKRDAGRSTEVGGETEWEKLRRDLRAARMARGLPRT